MAIPDGITADDVREGRQRFDRNEPHDFGPSTKFDLVIDGLRYPPKAVLGLAAHRILGRALSSADFKGGEESTCFRILRRLGFEVVQKSAPTGWIFQSNPDAFDLAGYLEAAETVLFTVNQQHFGEIMKPGQPVFFWRAKGRDPKGKSGIIGVGRIVRSPVIESEDPASLPFWKEENGRGPALRVKIKVTSVRTRAKDVLQRDWCKEDPVLRNLPILKQAAGTNFPLTDEQVTRLQALDEKTNVDFSFKDSAIALLAYAETYGGPVSVLPGSPVANAALRSGRAVSSIYNKVLNFRAIDPRDERSGLDSAGDVDRLVWDKFFREDTGEIDHAGLVAMLGATESPNPSVAADIEQAPDDNIAQLTRQARKVRRGQRKFRQNLLQIHEGKCAVTGTGVDSVLEACHILQHAQSGVNQTINGLLLRADIHALFDDGFITIDADGIIHTAPELAATEYSRHHGKKIGPRDANYPLSDALLAERNRALAWFQSSVPGLQPKPVCENP